MVSVAVLVAACGSDEPVAVNSDAPPPDSVPACEDLRASGVVDGPLSDDPDIAAAQQWRADMGFDSSIAAVESARTASTAIPEAGAFPHPMTDDEAEQLFARGDGPASMLSEYGAEHPDVFAGVWIDNVEGAATIGVTDDPTNHEAELRERNGGSLSGIKIARLERTLVALVDLQRTVERRLAGRFTSVGQVTDLNMVGVSLPEPDAEAEATLNELAAGGGICFDGYGVVVPVVGAVRDRSVSDAESITSSP